MGKIFYFRNPKPGERIAYETIDLRYIDGPSDSKRNDNSRDQNQTERAKTLCHPQSCIPYRKCNPSFQSLALPVVGLCVCALFLGCGANSLQGSVAATANPQVAIYTVTPQQPGNVTIFFGTTTSYGFQTWTQQTQPTGAPVSIYVAGMKANTLYHMQAVVQYGDGTTVKDVDRTFKTGSYPASSLPSITTATTPGQTPQPGIEMLNTIESTVQISAADLSGNIIWAYNPGLSLGGASWVAPKQLANGDFIAVVAINSSLALTTSPPAGAPNLVREFDLAGNTIKQITMAQLNAALAAANYNLTLLLFSHDINVLPNGHWLVLANTLKSVVLTGQTTPTQVLGDVIVDLDTNLKPVWVWNEFDHLDVNRHPWMFPDWTHTNAVIYSPDDGNLIVSLRHQNWIVKVDYYNGTGTGDILWHLGAGGDFKLLAGTHPQDWTYAQHGISFTTPNTTGIFGLAVMDNGDDRQYPGGPVGSTCGTGGSPACYSTVPVLQINESAKTATLEFHQILPSSLYSFFGGNSLMLSNGDIEYDLAGLAPEGSQVFEVTNEPTPQTVWNLKLNQNYAYRSYRLPSLYPGVQW
jgi:arylsulfate sulfotransferase